MRTFTIILVDDEKQILQGMLNGVPWDELGYQVVATADNEQEALELVQMHHPDLLLSDIKMPFMTGIELAKNIHENYMQIKIVLFSGFNEFEYARSAIRYGVSEYLLKPIDFHEMNKLLMRIHDELEMEYDARFDRERQKKIYQESLPLLRQRYFMSLLHSNKDTENVKQRLETLDVKLDSLYIQVMVINIPEPDGDVLTAISVAEMIEEMLNKVCRCYSVRYSDRLVYLLCFNQMEGTQNIIKSLDEAANMAQRFLNRSFSGGMGSVVTDLRMLTISYWQAKEALEYNLVLEDECVTFYNDLLSSEKSSGPDWQMAAEELEYSIKHGTDEIVIKEVNSLLDQLQQCHYSFNEYQMTILEIIFYLSKLYKRYDIHDSDGLSGSKHMAMRILSLHDGVELNNWLLHYCLFTNHAIQAKEVDQNNILAKQAKEYVDMHYSDPEISVDTICGMLHISSSHFSKVFRIEYGTSFLSYLTEKRMNEAERLLLTTDYKSREIGEMVGYTEPNYFSYVFKKNRNVSPAKYRKQRKINEQ